MSYGEGQMSQDEFQSYKAAFDAFDWNHNGKISYKSLQVKRKFDTLYKSSAFYLNSAKISPSKSVLSQKAQQLNYIYKQAAAELGQAQQNWE